MYQGNKLSRIGIDGFITRVSFLFPLSKDSIVLDLYTHRANSYGFIVRVHAKDISRSSICKIVK